MKSILKNAIIVLVACFFSFPMLAQKSHYESTFNEYNYASQEVNKSKEKNKKDEFKLFGALSFNSLNVQSEHYETTAGLGWMLGGAYKRGNFLYWEVGARYNRALFDLANKGDTTTYMDRLFAVSNMDIPITIGINTLWFASRIVGLRIFISLVPEFVVGVNDNDLNITRDDLNTFNLCGQGGIGVDVTFLYVEAGINYGFNDLLKNHSPTNPIQGFVSLGFRF
jgi:hypothetical protein